MTRVDTGLGHVELRPYKRRLSHSQISVLHPDNRWSCPRQWSYANLMKLPRPPSSAQCVGRMLDAAATEFWIARLEGCDAVSSYMRAESAADDEAQKCQWPAGDDSHRRAAIDAVETLCAFLIGHCQQPPALSLQLNHEFTVRGSDGELVTMVGRSDWVEPGAVVVDLKTTGTRKWDKDGVPDADWLTRGKEQITVYRLGLAATGLPDGSGVPVAGPGAIVALCLSPSRKTPICERFDFDITTADADRMLTRIVEADEIARPPQHAARPGDACSFCPFVERCRADMQRLSPTDVSVAA